MDENKEINSSDPKREKVRVIPLSAIDDAPEHPFGVRDDDEMAELVESISTFGVINPVIVRKSEGERYELISGHRRKHACLKLGIDTLPAIVRDLSREEAVIYMVDSNLQREHILPSERAKAYKMKLDAIKRQGSRTDLTSRPLGEKLLSVDEIANSTDEHEYSANFLFTLWKRVRKYGAFITGITQNVEDLLQSHTARTMLANSELVVMLNQAATDRAELADLMGISDLQMSYITGVEAGHGLVKIGSALVPFVNRVQKDTMLYKLMSTKPGEA